MALLYAGIPCVIREILLKDKPAKMLAVSAKGTVPVLQMPDGRVIDESLDIMRLALNTGLDPEGWLQADAAQVDGLIGQNDLVFKRHLDRYKYPDRFEVDTNPVTHYEQGLLWLAALNQRLSDHEYLCGQHPSMADIALFPFVRQFAAVDPDRFKANTGHHLQFWLTGWLQSELFINAMHRYPRWHAGDEEQCL